MRVKQASHFFDVKSFYKIACFAEVRRKRIIFVENRIVYVYYSDIAEHKDY